MGVDFTKSSQGRGWRGTALNNEWVLMALSYGFELQITGWESNQGKACEAIFRKSLQDISILRWEMLQAIWSHCEPQDSVIYCKYMF